MGQRFALRSELRTSSLQVPELLVWLSVLERAIREARSVKPVRRRLARAWLRSSEAGDVVELVRGAGVALPPHADLLRRWQAGWQREMPRAAA